MSQSVLIAVIALGGPLVGFLGSILGSVIAPWILDHFERKSASEVALRELFTDYFDTAQRVYLRSERGQEALEVSRHLTTLDFRLESLLTGKRRPIGLMLRDVTTSTVREDVSGAKILAALLQNGTDWLSGAKKAKAAYDEFIRMAQIPQGNSRA